MEPNKTVTYYAAQDLEIQSCAIHKGQVIGSGDLAAGKFKAAPGLEPFVTPGHVKARLDVGRIVTEKPKTDKAAPPPAAGPSEAVKKAEAEAAALFKRRQAAEAQAAEAQADKAAKAAEKKRKAEAQAAKAKAAKAAEKKRKAEAKAQAAEKERKAKQSRR